ncbi:MAG: hypothetical protein AAGM38_16965, partial [Pseudomonadota bacterium]
MDEGFDIDAVRRRVQDAFAPAAEGSREAAPMHVIRKSASQADLAALPAPTRAWAEAIGFQGEAGALAL